MALSNGASPPSRNELSQTGHVKSTNGPEVEAKPVITDFLSAENAQARRHRKLLDQLIASGIETVIDVPKIAIIGKLQEYRPKNIAFALALKFHEGSQSAGKSSILEALSGISFPRSSGTCTRCPSEVRLFSSDKAWVCKISLRFEKDIQGNQLKHIKVVPFGEEITDPSKVQHRLIQAQKAILNPTRQVQDSLDDANGDLLKAGNEIQFSENVICIEITGKDVRDLSVVDLPGLIENVGENENEENIELIRKLVKNEISKDNCVILSCISMNEDFQNQASVTLAKKADPTGQRTLGVLTKPDRIEKGTFENWLPILEGKEQKLRHSYYVVKNPDPEQLTEMTHEESREDERKYFQREDQWQFLDSRIKLRLGSPCLAAKLSVLLEEIIKAKMPIIFEKVRKSYEETAKKLSDLPEQIKDTEAVSCLTSTMDNFRDQFCHALRAFHEEGSLADTIYMLSLSFMKTMAYLRPRFVPITPFEEEKLRKISTSHPILNLQSLKTLRDYLFDKEKADLKALDISFEEEITARTDVDDMLDELVDVIIPPKGIICTSKGPLQMDLLDIRKDRARATRHILPNNVPWTVKESLIKKCIEPWSAISSAFLEKVVDSVLEESNALLEKHFLRYQIGGLHHRVQSTMDRLIREEARETKSFLANLVEMQELHSTIGAQDFLDRQATLEAEITAAREACVIQVEADDQNDEKEEAALTDDVKEEIKLVAEVRAYWQVSSQRFMENVCSAIFKIFLKRLDQKCKNVLDNGLGLHGADSLLQLARQYMQEDAVVVQQRDELATKKNMLFQCLTVINAFRSGALEIEN